MLRARGHVVRGSPLSEMSSWLRALYAQNLPSISSRRRHLRQMRHCDDCKRSRICLIRPLFCRLPGTKQRVGIDALIGLVPGIGDVATTVLSSYIIWEARNLGVSRFALARMLANLGIHATVGSVPLLGDVFDAFFRVNQRNMRILRSQLER